MTKSMTFKEMQQFKAALQELEKRKVEGGHLRKWFLDTGPFSYDKYPKHMLFFKNGEQYLERLFMAANRVGKSVAGGYEAACHATGQYPDWWEGKRFDHPTEIWVAGDTGQTTRDIIQDVLCGYPNAPLGSGMIQGDLITQVRRRSGGISDAFDTVKIRHVTGGESIIGFKSYDQGRRAFQGTAKHFIWLDEECPQDVYNECMIRTMTTDGRIAVTFTPLQGMTVFILDFLKEAHREAEAGGMVI